MEYRTVPRSGECVSVIGLGAGSLHSSSPSEQERAVSIALDAGVNIMDFIPSEASGFEGIVRALKGKRERAMLQIHIGACYESGRYGWTVDAKKAIPEFEARLRSLGTDYADFGFIHCIDEESDFAKVVHGGILDYALKQKESGIIRHLAFSTHSVEIALMFIELGIFDWAMFSINPMYDYTDESQYGKGGAEDRMKLYRAFEGAGIGVSVMKAFAGGQLLDAAQSPFGRALSRFQCIQYALDKPGVRTVLPGVRNAKDVKDVLSFIDASPNARDYSVLGTMSPASREGRCVYCNHCQPCPEGIPIGLVNKYYDLARQDDDLARDHYLTLNSNASDCIECGHCNERCPFEVDQRSRMMKIKEYFDSVAQNMDSVDKLDARDVDIQVRRI